MSVEKAAAMFRQELSDAVGRLVDRVGLFAAIRIAGDEFCKGRNLVQQLSPEEQLDAKLRFGLPS